MTLGGAGPLHIAASVCVIATLLAFIAARTYNRFIARIALIVAAAPAIVVEFYLVWHFVGAIFATHSPENLRDYMGADMVFAIVTPFAALWLVLVVGAHRLGREAYRRELRG